jgi:hypothetical protein
MPLAVAFLTFHHNFGLKVTRRTLPIGGQAADLQTVVDATGTAYIILKMSSEQQ